MAGTATAPKKVRKIGGKIYRLKSCKAPKTTVAKLRKAGKTARVIAGCAYEGPKAKVCKSLMLTTTVKVAGVKKRKSTTKRKKTTTKRTYRRKKR